MTIQPLAAVEQGTALDPEIDWRLRIPLPAGVDAYPVPDPDRWCYACWTWHSDGFPESYHHQRGVEPLDSVLTHLSYGVIPDALGIPLTTEHWLPAHVESLRALVDELQWRLGYAEHVVNGQ